MTVAKEVLPEESQDDFGGSSSAGKQWRTKKASDLLILGPGEGLQSDS